MCVFRYFVLRLLGCLIVINCCGLWGYIALGTFYLVMVGGSATGVVWFAGVLLFV